ncbi:hypothetical protein JCM8547_004421 [Rhodosporidiobolus lusitaniae]
MSTDEVWESLCQWIKGLPGAVEDPEKHIRLEHNAAGRGLVARGDLPPNTLLISIPNGALLNLRTLRPLYPSTFTSLNAIQHLSLHIALEFRRHVFSPSSSRPTAKKPSTKDFWPFLATLPRSFPTVPLTWAIESRSSDTLRAEYDVPPGDAPLEERSKREKNEGERERKRRKRYGELCELLPPSVRRRQDDIEKRFREDWRAVRQVWSEQKGYGGELAFMDFLLGWLNVNTRCVYFDIDGKKENNLTLAPVIDMINHRPGRQTKPSPRISSLTFSSPSASSSDPPLKDGDELAFSYGPHEDAMLLAEYGFVVGRDNDYNAVEVDRFIEGMFDAQGREGELKKGMLEDEGFWGDMTLQSMPEPPSASWRVLIALRLLHLRLPSSLVLSADVLAPWYNVVTGAIETISSTNEAKVTATLKVVCKAVAEEAEEGGKRCREVRKKWEREEVVEEEMKVSLGMLETVWTEEGRIARAVEEGLSK